jgi:uncharacterized damage-inducible protein DinB
VKVAQMFAHWEEVRAGLLATIDRFEEHELAFVALPGGWPAGEVMLHIAEVEDIWLHSVVRGELGEIGYWLRDYHTKAAIRDVLARARERTQRFLDSVTLTDLDNRYTGRDGAAYPLRWIIWHVLEHEVHHRGELSMTLGLLGREGLDV